MLDLNDGSPPLSEQRDWLPSQRPPGPPAWAIERAAPSRPAWVPAQGEPGEREDDSELQPAATSGATTKSAGIPKPNT